MMYKQVILFAALIIALIVGGVSIYNYFNSVELTVEPSNITSYSLEKSGKKFKENNSGEKATFRVPKFSTITINYTAKQPYESNEKDITINESADKLTIKPFYSKEHLSSLVDENKDQITNTITAYDPSTLSGYDIRNITLYHYGDWASAKLVWVGKYGQNTDTQRVILQKKDGNWFITGQPSILFFYKNTPTIPVDILKRVNES